MPECGAILGQGFDSPHLHQEQQTGLVPGHIRLSSRGKRNYPVNTTAINTKVTMKTSQMRGLFRFIEGPFSDQIHGQSEGGRSHDHIQDQLHGNCDRRDNPMINSRINPVITQRARPQENPRVNPLV